MKLHLDLMTSILYASLMNKETPYAASESGSKLRQGLAHPLLRLLVAGLVASVITFALLLFMRFLIVGYDRTTSDAITRYLSLQTVISHRAVDDRLKRIERPAERPEFTGMDESDFKQDAETFMPEQAEDAQVILSPQVIETDIQLPTLESVPLSDQEKLLLIKQEILSGEN